MDDILVASTEPWTVTKEIEKEFKLRNKTYSPLFYLGMDMKKMSSGKVHLSAKRYIKEMLRKFQQYYSATKRYNNRMV